MRLSDRLNKLDDRVGFGAGVRAGETRRDYLGRVARARFVGFADPNVYRELVALHDKVASLEARLDRVETNTP